MSTPDDFFWIDLHYQEAPNLIATGVLITESGLLLIDPGPTTALPGLGAGLEAKGYGLTDVHAVLLTHIHLDHAGATGTIVQQHPDIDVVVHRIGAPHVAEPSRLLASAKRIYGDSMDRLWGEVAAVPEDNLTVVRGGEMLTLGGHTLNVAYTPGHAVHHVSYYDRSSQMAFVGDVAGMRISDADYVLPVTPPPDVDLERWLQSIETVRAWAPEVLFPTHCGPSFDPASHLTVMAERLQGWADEVRDVLQAAPDDAAVENAAEAFTQRKLEAMREAVPAAYQAAYAQFGDPRGSFDGLARYWRKQVA